MCSDIAISVKNLTKTYRIFGHPTDRIKQALTLGRMRFHSEFTALQDISFEIRKGEAVGIIGRNGSGKSTLLQLICGILKPTSGEVRVNGRISALLELGSGFNPEFTGRENVYFQGAVMGFTQQQMDNRIDDIIAFADIGEFIDQPVRTYSSGMFVRLAFAVAVAAEPDVLVVDEALAVGDARFQAKCFRKIRGVRDNGGSVLFVTHATDQVSRICDRAILFDHGKLTQCGEPKDVINRYLTMMLSSTEQPVTSANKTMSQNTFSSRAGYNPGEYRYGNGAAEIIDYRFITDIAQSNILQFENNQKVEIAFQVVFHRHVAHATFAIAISTPDGISLFGINSRDISPPSTIPPYSPGDVTEIKFSISLHFAKGDYQDSLSAFEKVYSMETAPARRAMLARQLESVRKFIRQPKPQPKPAAAVPAKAPAADVRKAYQEGLDLYSAGSLEAAGEQFRKVLEMDPGHAPAASALKRVQQELRSR